MTAADPQPDADEQGAPLRGLDSIERCFAGAIPAVLSTASADGVPNVTWISRAHQVDDERVALSNQFLSKTARNLAENPRASLLLIDPVTHDEYRLALVYERTERRGRVFDRLRADVEAIAAITGMQHVFRLRAADIFRVVELVQVPPNPTGEVGPDRPAPRELTADVSALADLAARIGRCGDLDTLVDTVLDGVARLGFPHAHVMLSDEVGERLYTVGSRGFDAEGIGAEVYVGEGLIGIAAARCEPMRAASLLQMTKYSRSMREQFEESGESGPPREVPMPALPKTHSRLVVPAMSAGELVGVLVADSVLAVAFNDADERVLTIVANLFGSALERVRLLERDEEPASTTRAVEARAAAISAPVASPVAVRFFPVDGSTFLENDYLIKGVAGRILWALLRQHVADGRVDFTNKELRLDPSLDLPGFKDNLESRLILLKRRLDERHAPVRIERTARGRLRLCVERPVQLHLSDG